MFHVKHSKITVLCQFVAFACVINGASALFLFCAMRDVPNSAMRVLKWRSSRTSARLKQFSVALLAIFAPAVASTHSFTH